MKSKIASTQVKKKSPTQEIKSTGTAKPVPPSEAASLAAKPDPKPVSSPPPAPSKSASKKPLIQTVVNAAKNILKPKIKTAPAKLSEPVQPVVPEKPVAPVKTLEPVKTKSPVKAAIPAKVVEAVKPVPPVKSAEPVKPNPAKTIAPAKVPETVKAAKVVKSPEPVKEVKASEPVKTVIPVKPVLPAKSAEPLKPVEVVKPVETTKAVKTPEPVKEVKAKASEPVNPAATLKPSAPVVLPAPAAPVALPPTEHKTRVTTTTVVRRTYTRKKKIEAPAILSESDTTPAPTQAGPGEKFSLGPTPTSPGFDTGEVELPEAYGTKKLFLTARDPHWLYAHWDLTLQQQHAYNAESSDCHLVLRIYAARLEGHPVYEIHVHPESRHWFVHVERAGNSYCAELGYYSPLGKWIRIAVSSATVTPPDAASPETDVEFATIPFEFPFAKLMHIIEEAVRENLPLAQAIEELRRTGHPDLPRLKSSAVSGSPALAHVPGTNGHFGAPVAPSAPSAPPMTWTAQQEQALAKVISIDQSRRIWMGSLEITELIRRRLTLDVSSPMRAFGGPGPGAGVSSLDNASSPAIPFGAAAPSEKSFWFNVNAELIVYGATEPGAKVTLGGHEIKLRADGTFSYRFALPDGKYDLPAVAVSSDGTDARAADLKFSRETEYLGDVGTHPQDPSLKAPLVDNLPANL